MKRFSILLVVALILSLQSGAQPVPRKPNIIVIVADDLGYGELSCQGNPEIPTPHIDSIAKNGVRFTSGYVTGPVCSPSRAGFMTGRYQTRFGHELNAIGKQNLEENIGLPLTEKTLADRLKAAGYVTGMAGKWHLGATERFHPQKRGFDEYFGFLHEGHFYVPLPYRGVTSFLRTNQVASGSTQTNGSAIWSTHLRNNEPPYDENNPILRGTKPIEENGYLTETFTREATAFIDRHQQEPFFLYLPYNAPHSPMQGTEKYLKRFENIPSIHRRIFAAMLAALDDGVGQVLAKVRELKLEEDTLIFFFSDNGGPTTELTSSNLPLSGGKGTLSEGGIRIPFMMQWKGRLPAGKVYDQPVITLDIFATALNAAGIHAQPDWKLDGVNLIPFLNGEKTDSPHVALYWRYGQQSALRMGDWKLVKGDGGRAGGAGAALYNLADDLGEKNNLGEKEPGRLKELSAIWEKWNNEQVEPIWSPNNGSTKAGTGKKNNE